MKIMGVKLYNDAERKKTTFCSSEGVSTNLKYFGWLNAHLLF